MKLKPQKRKLVAIDGDALMRAGVQGALLVDDSFVGATASMLAEEPVHEEPQGGAGVVRITGPLHQRAVDGLCAFVDGYDAISARFEEAIANEKADSVLLVIDSPGGSAAGLESAVARMVASKAKHGKPVVAHIDEMAASAAYWIASAVADEIVLPVAGRVGSIGCVAGWVDQSKAWQKLGIEWHIVREPAGKQENNPLSPVAELADQRSRELVKGYADRFVASVAASRGIDAKVVRALNAAMFEGQKAVDEKLADSVGTIESAAGRALELGTKHRYARNKEKQMKLTAMVAALVGLSVEASIEQVEVALEKKTKDINEAGAKDLDGLLVALDKANTRAEAFKEKASKFDAAEQTKVADEKAAKLAAEKAELATALDAAVKDGHVTPARRAKLEEKAQERGNAFVLELVEELREGAPIGATRAHVEKLAGPDTSAAAVSAETKRFLERAGLTVKDMQEAAEAEKKGSDQ